MSKIIAVANQKGGVAKTTSTHNLAISLAMQGKKVLMIDLDSQASLTISAGLEPTDIADNCIVSVLTDEESRKRDIKECIHSIPVGDKSCFIIPSIIDLADQEWKMFSRVSRENILRRALNPIRDDYDFILIDCPPQLSILTINALSCANGVIIPVKTDYLSYRGITQLMDTIDTIKLLTNPDLQVYGVVATYYEKRTKNSNVILAELEREYNLIGIIPKTVVSSEGIFKGMAAAEIAPNQDISKRYMEIAEMIIADDYTKKGEITNG